MTEKIPPIRLGKHVFTAGLDWAALTKLRELKSEARQQMKKFAGDCSVIRSGAGSAQVGIGSSNNGQVGGQLSLAAAIADHVCTDGVNANGGTEKFSSWLGLFELADGRWYFLGVRESAVFQHTDFVGTYEEAYSRLEQNYGISGWEAVLVSEAHIAELYHHSIVVKIEDALGMVGGKLPGANKYRLASSKNTNKKIAVGVCAIGVSIGVVTVALWLQRQQEEQDLLAMQAQRSQMAPAVVQRKEVEAVKGWLLKPLPDGVVEQCLQSLDVPAAPGSWQISSIRCTEIESEFILDRGMSTVDNLRELIPAAVIDQSFNSASWTRAYDRDGLRFDSSIGQWSNFGEELVSALQRMDVPFQIGPATVPPAPAVPKAEQATTEVVPAFWKERTFTIGPTAVQPSAIVPLLSEDGVRISSLRYTSGFWIIEGVIYAK